MLVGIVVKRAALEVETGTRPQRVCHLFLRGKMVPCCKPLCGLGCDGAASLLPPLVC